MRRAPQRAGRHAAGEQWTETGAVFTTRRGTLIEPRNMNRHLDTLCERAGVPRISFPRPAALLRDAAL
jgi:hypothetical protein